MNKFNNYLPKARSYFKEFIKHNIVDYYEEMKNCKTGGNSGYGKFYRDDDVIQHLRDIVHNLSDTLGDVSIPKQFSSPKSLVECWNNFYNFLKKRDKLLFDEIDNYFQKKKIGYPYVLGRVHKIHQDVLYMLEEILSMDEVKVYLNQNQKIDILEYQNVFDIVVITALYETEFTSLKKIPSNFSKFKVESDDTIYFKSKIGDLNVLFATDDKMGMAASSSLSTKIIAKFSPKYLIMSGIAAGVKGNDFNLGDILVARYTWNYESGKYKYNAKTKLTVFEPNPEQLELDNSIVHLINELKDDEELLANIKNSFQVKNNDKVPKNNLKIHLGPLASGSAVLADEKKVESIRKGNRKLIGIDMETYGVYYSAKYFAKKINTIAISIKSISDFADSRKNDSYRNYAAHTSAIFIYELIKRKLQ